MSCENETEVISWSCYLRTLFATSGALLAMAFVGIIEAQSAVILLQLREADSSICVTLDEETWIASLGLIMAPISSLIAGPFTDTFGRKTGIQFFYLDLSVGFGFMAFARNVYHIYIGRTICGIGIGFDVCGLIYLAEVCTKKQRTDYFAFLSVLFSGGVLLSTVIGGYLPWRLSCLIFSVTCFVLFILECFIPESPPWLFKKGKEKACSKSLQRLGRTQEQICQELNILKLSTANNEKTVELKTFLKPTVWKPFVIMCVFFFLQSASGVYNVIYYSVDFVERLGTGYDPLNISVILSVARFLTTATVGTYIRSRLGRKSTVAISASGMTVACVGTAAYEYMFRNVGVPGRTYHLVPVGLAILYMASAVIGVLCLPTPMTSEVFPLNVRGTMTGVTFFIEYIIMFVAIKMHYVVLDMLQLYGLLFAFAAFSFVAVLFGVFVLPETHNKSLFEIEQGFLPKRLRENSPS